MTDDSPAAEGQTANDAQRSAPSDLTARLDGRKTRAERDETLTEHVYRLILEDFIRARMKPGELVQLTALADKYAVSRTPVREALGRLEREGVVKAIPYKGYLVRPIEPRDVHDIFFMRQLLEGAGTELAAERLDREEIQRLRQAKLPVGEVMTLEYDQVSHDFHRTIVNAAGSRRLLDSFEGLYNDVRRLQYAGIGTPRPDLIHEEHMAILDALEQRDPALARQRMEDHINLTRLRALNTWLEGL